MSTSNSLKPTLETRVIGGLLIVILVLAFLALYIFPGHTDQDFAWTIKPNTTAILIGSGYMAGALFFVRVATGKKWHPVQAGFLPITSFTILMMVATFLHWDRFHHGTFIFFLWVGVYAITPILVPFLWWWNHKKDSHKLDERDLRYSISLRWALGMIGALGIGVSLAGFIWPSFYVSITPWKLTELTARILSGWSLLATATILSIAIDGRWSATRLLLQSAVFSQAITILALPRIWTDLDPTKPMTYVFVGGLLAALVVSVMIHVVMDRRSRSSESVLKLQEHDV
jgi:hypothetical protein